MAGFVVLDTDVCSFLLKRDSRAEAYRPLLTEQTLCLSFQSVAELYLWAELHGWGAGRRMELEAWMQRFVIVPFDDETARAWARVRAGGKRHGRPIGAADAWVAAVAIRHGCALLTHNAAHFGSIEGLQMLTA